MNARFHLPGDLVSGAVLALPDVEGRHLRRVLRLEVGAQILVFDGRGSQFEARVTSVDGGTVRVRVAEPVAPAPEARVAITLAAAVLKGDKMDDVVRDAVMLGAAAIQPVVTTRTEISLAALERGRRRQRWERVALASVKQCGRAMVPSIGAPIVFADALAAIRARTLPSPPFMLVEPHAARDARRLADLQGSAPREATVFIGPEGGWTDAEVVQGAAACQPVTVGGRVLRADAMATVTIAALFTVWGEY